MCARLKSKLFPGAGREEDARRGAGALESDSESHSSQCSRSERETPRDFGVARLETRANVNGRRIIGESSENWRGEFAIPAKKMVRVQRDNQ